MDVEVKSFVGLRMWWIEEPPPSQFDSEAVCDRSDRVYLHCRCLVKEAEASPEFTIHNDDCESEDDYVDEDEGADLGRENEPTE